jgi:hypothetical protein
MVNCSLNPVIFNKKLFDVCDSDVMQIK